MANLNIAAYNELDREMAHGFDEVKPISLTSSFNNDFSKVTENFDNSLSALKM